MTSSIVIGFAVGLANFFLISRIVKILIRKKATSRWRIVVWITLKIALVAAIIVLIVQKGYVTPLAFLGGFTLALGGIILCMTLRGSGSSPKK